MSNIEPLKWIDDRIAYILRVPRMFGSNESIELQLLQLLEFKCLTLYPEKLEKNPRYVIELWINFIQKKYPDKSTPLFENADTNSIFFKDIEELVNDLSIKISNPPS